MNNPAQLVTTTRIPNYDDTNTKLRQHEQVVTTTQLPSYDDLSDDLVSVGQQVGADIKNDFEFCPHSDAIVTCRIPIGQFDTISCYKIARLSCQGRKWRSRFVKLKVLRDFVLYMCYPKETFYFSLQILKVRIPVEDRELDGVINVPRKTSWAGYAVVLTHGAGGDMYHDHVDSLTSRLADTGILCLRFTCKTPNFQYRTRCFASAVVSVGRFCSSYEVELVFVIIHACSSKFV